MVAVRRREHLLRGVNENELFQFQNPKSKVHPMQTKKNKQNKIEGEKNSNEIP